MRRRPPPGSARLPNRASPPRRGSFSWWRFPTWWNAGFPPAQGQLGGCYFKGTGVPQDDAQAVVWFRKGAEQGHAGAQCNLATCYYRGQGVPRDEAQAIAWLRKAAEQGDEQAISILRELGQEVPPVRTAP